MSRCPIDFAVVGQEMYDLIGKLFPLHRSITGDGVRETLSILAELAPVTTHEIPAGTTVLDWEVPQEWRIRDAYVKDSRGRRVIDYQKCNLHVVNYSAPVQAHMSWTELQPHLHTLPDHPDWIPYKTGYFRDTWGFCLSHREWQRLAAQGGDSYEVVIDAEFFDGSLTYGELVLPGDSDQEVLLYAHVCHPSLANDNLSGIAVATFLAKALAEQNLRYTYRFVFAPATIGAISWLASHEQEVAQIRHGLVLTLLGDAGHLTYKNSRRGNADIDLTMAHVLKHAESPGEIREFTPAGYDERQFCSPGFNLPVGRLTRSVHGEFPEYHTSADNLELVRPEFLADSLATCLAVVEILENNRQYLNRFPKGEPQLGRHGIYRAYGEADDRGRLQEALLWLLNLADGQHRLLDVAERSRLPFALVLRAAELLLECELIEEVAPTTTPNTRSD